LEEAIMNQINERIRKLLALSKDAGATEAERDSALARASEMMLKYNIEHIDDANAPGVEISDGTPPGFNARWHISVVIGCSILYACEHVFEASTSRYGFVGKPVNIEAARDTFISVCEQIEALYTVALKSRNGIMGTMTQSERADFRQTFKEATAYRFRCRCDEIMAAQLNRLPRHKALMVIDNSKREAAEFLAKNHVVTSKAVTTVKSGRGTGAGLIAGEHIKIQEQL
jgi:hypothetical protein